MEGTGSVTYPDGSVYVGAMKGDQAEGQGAITYPDGSTYSGAWAAGVIQGKGRPPMPTAWSTRAISSPPGRMAPG